MNDNSGSSKRSRWDLAVSDVFTACALLSRLPVPLGWCKFERSARATWTYPVVGAVLGLIAGLTLWLLLALGIPAGSAAALALGVMILLTGALHEDGFSDCADGLGGGHDRAKCLEIMRDSRIGAYGTVAIGINLLVRWSALAALATTAPVAALVVAGALARAPLPLTMALIRPARSDGLAARTGEPPVRHALIALATALVLGTASVGTSAIWLLVIAVLAPLPLLLLATRKIHGITGDVLGGMEQLSEMAVLISLAALFT